MKEHSERITIFKSELIMKNMASRTSKKKIVHIMLLCSFGMMNQIMKSALPGAPVPGAPAAELTNARVAITQLADLLYRLLTPAAAAPPAHQPGYTDLIFTLPGACGIGLLGVVGVYAGYQKLMPHGPVARAIEHRIMSAIDNINSGISRKKAPLRQIADVLKGLLELRLALNDAICRLPEKYDDLSFLQTCCDQIDAMLNTPDIAYTYRYVAQQDKTLQALITNVHDSMLAKLSYEHLMGLHQSIQGKSVSTLGNVAEVVQWMRNGFDPVHATTNSLSIASRIATHTVRDGVQALACSSLALQKREDQMKVLNCIRSSLLSSSGTQKTWFEKLRDWTGVEKFLKFCKAPKKMSATSALSVSTIDQQDKNITTVPMQETVSIVHENDKNGVAEKRVVATHAMPMHKYLIHIIMQQVHKHSLLTNVAACTVLCAVIALGVRNYQSIGNTITATTSAVYQRAKAAGVRCLQILKLRSYENRAATA